MRNSHSESSELAQRVILERLAAPADSLLPLPRVLVVLAHPDDEVLALGSRLERYRESRLLCVTDGAPRDGEDAQAHGFTNLEAYREARREELTKALAQAGLPPDASRSLAIPDKEAAFHLAALTEAVAREIAEFQPEAVLTHPYEGGHPDHDSCAFAVHAAVSLSPRGTAPVLVEAPSYHADPRGIVIGQFLLHTQSPQAVIRELSETEQERKHARLACFVSQRDMLAQFPVTQEQFRIAPQYDFTAAPHDGLLLYESWGFLTGERFRDAAQAALQTLQLAPYAA